MGIHAEGGSSREDVGYEAEIFGGCGNVDLAIFVTDHHRPAIAGRSDVAVEPGPVFNPHVCPHQPRRFAIQGTTVLVGVVVGKLHRFQFDKFTVLKQSRPRRTGMVPFKQHPGHSNGQGFTAGQTTPLFHRIVVLKDGMLINSLTTDLAGVIISISPVMAFFRIIFTNRSLLISLVPSYILEILASL